MQHFIRHNAPAKARLRRIACALASAAAIASFGAPAQAQMTREKASVYHGLATVVLTSPPYKLYKDTAIGYVTEVQKQQFQNTPDRKPPWSDVKIFNQISLFMAEAASIAQVEIFETIEKAVPFEEAGPLLARWQQGAESKAMACLVVLPGEERHSTGVARCNREHNAALTAADEVAVGRIGDAITAAFGMPKTNAAINGAICLAVDNLTREMSTDGVTYTLRLELGLGDSPQLPCETIKLRWAGLVGLQRVIELESSMVSPKPQ